MELIVFFLPFILLLGFITSFEDVKFGKIRNVWVISAIIISVFLHLVLFMNGLIDLQYIVRISLLTLFSFIVGFALYLMKLWSAGDAKIFAAYISLFPFTFYRFVTTSFWPLDILVNIVLPVFIFFLIQSIFTLKKEQLFLIIKKIFNPKTLALYLLTIFSISWIVLLVFGYFNILSNFLLNVLGIMCIRWVLMRLFSAELIYIMLFVAVLRVFLNQNYILRLVFWQSFLLMTLTYALIIFFINELSSLYIKKVNINFLKEGMQPVQFIIKHKNSYFISDKIPKDSELVYEQKPEGLTKEDIENVQKLHRTGFLHFNNITVQQSIPFAPFIFAGVLLSLLVKGNIIVWFRSLF